MSDSVEHGVLLCISRPEVLSVLKVNGLWINLFDTIFDRASERDVAANGATGIPARS